MSAMTFAFTNPTDCATKQFFKQIMKPVYRKRFCSRDILGLNGRSDDARAIAVYSNELEFPTSETPGEWWDDAPEKRDGVCVRCDTEGEWEYVDGLGHCVRGCYDCVKRHNWTWGKFQHMPNVSMNTVPDTDEYISTPIPCNGSDEDIDVGEYTNLEIAIREISDFFDTFHQPSLDDPDSAPRWKDIFALLPERCHHVICKECLLWGTPEQVKERYIIPGEPHALLELQDNVMGRMRGLQPRRLFLSDSEEEDEFLAPDTLPIDDDELEQAYSQDPNEDSTQEGNATQELCQQAQEILDTSISGTFNEESYRQLSNLLMKIHQG